MPPTTLNSEEPVYSHPVFGACTARMLDRWINFGHTRRNFPSG